MLGQTFWKIQDRVQKHMNKVSLASLAYSTFEGQEKIIAHQYYLKEWKELSKNLKESNRMLDYFLTRGGHTP